MNRALVSIVTLVSLLFSNIPVATSAEETAPDTAHDQTTADADARPVDQKTLRDKSLKLFLKLSDLPDQEEYLDEEFAGLIPKAVETLNQTKDQTELRRLLEKFSGLMNQQQFLKMPGILIREWNANPEDTNYREILKRLLAAKEAILGKGAETIPEGMDADLGTFKEDFKQAFAEIQKYNKAQQEKIAKAVAGDETAKAELRKTNPKLFLSFLDKERRTHAEGEAIANDGIKAIAFQDPEKKNYFIDLTNWENKTVRIDFGTNPAQFSEVLKSISEKPQTLPEGLAGLMLAPKKHDTAEVAVLLPKNFVQKPPTQEVPVQQPEPVKQEPATPAIQAAVRPETLDAGQGVLKARCAVCHSKPKPDDGANFSISADGVITPTEGTSFSEALAQIEDAAASERMPPVKKKLDGTQKSALDKWARETGAKQP